MLNSKVIMLSKTFQSLFIPVLVNAASVSILFEHSSYDEYIRAFEK